MNELTNWLVDTQSEEHESQNLKVRSVAIILDVGHLVDRRFARPRVEKVQKVKVATVTPRSETISPNLVNSDRSLYYYIKRLYLSILILFLY